MKNVFEIYLTKDAVSQTDFQSLYNAVVSYGSFLQGVRFHVTIKDNHVKFFVESDNDLSALSSSTDFCILRLAKQEDIELPNASKKERFVQYVTGGGVVKLHEKMSTKKGKKLIHFIVESRRIVADKDQVNTSLFFQDAAGVVSVNKKSSFKFPAHLFAVDFKEASSMIKSEIPKYLNIEKVLSSLSPEPTNALLHVNTFPYLNSERYLNLHNFEFDKHSMIVGSSGSGKSKFIQLFIDRMYALPNKQNYRVVVVDPHASLAADFQHADVASSMELVDFNGEGAQFFAGAEADTTAATELTTTLMKSLMGDSFNPRVERVLRYSLFVLITAQSMSMGQLKRFLTEIELRDQILTHVKGHIPHNIDHFFNTDFNEIRTAHYDTGLLPIISIVDELSLQPTFLQEGGLSLAKSINENFITVFSLNKVSMGEKVVKTVAGLLIQQIFLLAQSKSFNQKVILFVDEVSIVQTPALAQILSEARKYNLFVVLAQQYFTQVEKGLRDAIFANVANYYCFRVSEEDASVLVGNLPMELPKEVAIEAKDQGVKEETLKARFLTELHPRECVVRIAANGSMLPSFKARTPDIETNSSSIIPNKSTQPSTVRSTTFGGSSTKTIVLEKFKEKAPVTIEDFYEKAEAAMEVFEPDKPHPFVDSSTISDNKHHEDSNNKALHELLAEQEPEPLKASFETTFENQDAKDTESTTSNLESADISSLAKTVLKFTSSDGTPVVERGMPSLDQLMKTQSTK